MHAYKQQLHGHTFLKYIIIQFIYKGVFQGSQGRRARCTKHKTKETRQYNQSIQTGEQRMPV